MIDFKNILGNWRKRYVKHYLGFLSAAGMGAVKQMEKHYCALERSLHDQMVHSIMEFRSWQKSAYRPLEYPITPEDADYCLTETVSSANVVYIHGIHCPVKNTSYELDLTVLSEMDRLILHSATVLDVQAGHGQVEWQPAAGKLIYRYTDELITDQQLVYMELIRLKAKDIYGEEKLVDVWFRLECSDYIPPDCNTDAPTLLIADAGYSQSPWANTYKGFIVGGVAPLTHYWSVDPPCNIDGANDETNVIVTFDPMDFPFFDGLNYQKFVYLNVTDARGCTYQYSRAIIYEANECQADVLVIGQDTGPHTVDVRANDDIHAYEEGFEVVSGPDHGTLTIVDAALGIVEYTPDPGYVGSDIVYYRWKGNSNQGTCQIQITVNAVDPPCPAPTITVNSVSHTQLGVVGPGNPLGEPNVLCLNISFTDVAALTDIVLRLTHLGVGIVLTPDLSTWDWDGTTLSGCTPVPKEGNYEIYIEATNACDTVVHTEYYEVKYNRAPAPADDTLWVLQDSVGCLDVTLNDYDENGDTLTLISIDGNPFDAVNTPVVIAGGHAVHWVDGQRLCVFPAAGFTGSFTFQYEVQDQGGIEGLVLTGTGNVTVTVEASCPGTITLDVVEDTTPSPDQFTTTVTLSPAPTGLVDYKYYYDRGAGYPSTPDSEHNSNVDVLNTDDAIVSVKVEAYDHDNGCIYEAETSAITII